MTSERRHRAYELLAGFRFKQVSPGTRMKNFADQLIPVVHGEYQHLGQRRVAPNLPRDFDPVEDRKRDINHGDVGLVLNSKLDSLPPGFSLSAYDEVGPGA